MNEPLIGAGVLITGATSALGAETARVLARARRLGLPLGDTIDAQGVGAAVGDLAAAVSWLAEEYLDRHPV